MTAPTHAELREKATKATPGPWGICVGPKSGVQCDCCQVHSVPADGVVAQVMRPEDVYQYGQVPADIETSKANARFIAAANPTAILALLDELDSEKKFSSQLIEWLNTAHIKLDAANVRIAAIETQVADLDAPIVNARLALEKIKELVEGEQDADEEEEFIIDIIEDWLTRYPQGAARVK